MSRLGIWGAGTAFETSQRFAKMLTKRGAGAMEMAALDLKARGLYISRMLSFRGTSFEIMYIPENKVCHPGFETNSMHPGWRMTQLRWRRPSLRIHQSAALPRAHALAQPPLLSPWVDPYR